MNAKQLVKKIGSKLLGKKENTQAVGEEVTVVQTTAEVKAPEILLLDRLGIIQLHENWRN